MRPVVSCLALLVAVPAFTIVTDAAAQDRDPFDAVRAAQALRDRQMLQVQRADDVAVDPYRFDRDTAVSTPPAAPSPRPGATPKSQQPAPSRTWLAPTLAAVAGIGVWLLRRRAGSGRADD